MQDREQALSMAMSAHFALNTEAMPVSSALFMVLLIPTLPGST